MVRVKRSQGWKKQVTEDRMCIIHRVWHHNRGFNGKHVWWFEAEWLPNSQTGCLVLGRKLGLSRISVTDMLTVSYCWKWDPTFFFDPEVIFRCYKYWESIKRLNCWRNALVDLHTVQARLQEVCESWGRPNPRFIQSAGDFTVFNFPQFIAIQMRCCSMSV